MKQYLTTQISQALQSAGISYNPDDLYFELPKKAEHGDLASNIAFNLAKSQKSNPRALAQTIVDHIKDTEGFLEKIEIAGPGFINFKFKSSFYPASLKSLLVSDTQYGKHTVGQNKKVMVEFVSANPTGPLTIGHGRHPLHVESVA